jgi:hypothetical protein
MSLLNRSSLYKTVDNVNEALFYNKPISKKEAKDILSWISGRLDTKYSYNHSIGLTDHDMKHPVYTFTGERLQCASMRHIMAEEACRVMIKLSVITGSKNPALQKTTKVFTKMLNDYRSYGKPEGTFCCGPCTIGLWRHLNAGGLKQHRKSLPEGILALHSSRDESGKWGRYPFYYTLLALSEIDDEAAVKEINYAMPACERALKRLDNRSKFSKRKRELLLRIMNTN